jgi:transcriptional regulator with XRE-family HTH domain
MGNATDEHIERLVKARWLAIGLSQTDLAEVLGAAFQQARDDSRADGADVSPLMQVAEALDISIDFFHSHAVKIEREDRDLSSAHSSLQSLLELRLLRAFNELRDDRTKRMLVNLAEQIVKRQANRQGDEA